MTVGIGGIVLIISLVLIVAALGFVVVGWALGWELESGDAGLGAWLALPAGAAIGFGGVRADAGFGRAR